MNKNDIDNCPWLKLENKEWKAFLLTDLFENIQRGKRLTKENSSEIKQMLNQFIENNKF